VRQGAAADRRPYAYKMASNPLSEFSKPVLIAVVR